jgi:hypothetical protein
LSFTVVITKGYGLRKLGNDVMNQFINSRGCFIYYDSEVLHKSFNSMTNLLGNFGCGRSGVFSLIIFLFCKPENLLHFKSILKNSINSSLTFCFQSFSYNIELGFAFKCRHYFTTFL